MVLQLALRACQSFLTGKHKAQIYTSLDGHIHTDLNIMKNHGTSRTFFSDKSYLFHNHIHSMHQYIETSALSHSFTIGILLGLMLTL